MYLLAAEIISFPDIGLGLVNVAIKLFYPPNVIWKDPQLVFQNRKHEQVVAEV